VEKVDGVLDGGIQVPDGCEVDMAHMVGFSASNEASITTPL